MSQLRRSAVVLVLLLGAGAAAAQPAPGGGFLAGTQLPILHWQHLLAMTAVGLWGGFLGAPALWVHPLIFPAGMLAGVALTAAGLTLPAVEGGIAALALVVGLMVALAKRPTVAVSAPIVAAFAFLHGNGHGELVPVGAPCYATGFLLGTLLLHMTGIAIGALAEWPGGTAVVRTFGVVIALAGLGMASLAA